MNIFRKNILKGENFKMVKKEIIKFKKIMKIFFQTIKMVKNYF